jgi:hypothetical protein
MKMFELIEQLKAMPEKMEGYNTEGELVVLNTRKLADALVNSLRNCDVGNADEQETRFTEFCDAHKYVGDDGALACSSKCPFYNKIDCGIHWGQVIFVEGATDERNR